jgi:hypothetical protein
VTARVYSHSHPAAKTCDPPEPALSKLPTRVPLGSRFAPGSPDRVLRFCGNSVDTSDVYEQEDVGCSEQLRKCGVLLAAAGKEVRSGSSMPNIAFAGVMCALLSGCSIGPKYHPPAIQPPPAFKEAPANATQITQGDQSTGLWTVAQPADAKIRGVGGPFSMILS